MCSKGRWREGGRRGLRPHPTPPPAASSRTVRGASPTWVPTWFPWPSGPDASSQQTGRTSCCRRGSSPPGPAPGARFLPGRSEGDYGPERCRDPPYPTAPASHCNSDPFPAGGALPEQPRTCRRGSPRSPPLRGRQASPFPKLLADSPDIVAQRRPSSSGVCRGFRK